LIIHYLELIESQWTIFTHLHSRMIALRLLETKACVAKTKLLFRVSCWV